MVQPLPENGAELVSDGGTAVPDLSVYRFVTENPWPILGRPQ
jgi:hypothetical protein